MKERLTLKKKMMNKILFIFKIFILIQLTLAATSHAITSSTISENSNKITHQLKSLPLQHIGEHTNVKNEITVALPQITVLREGFKNRTTTARTFFINFWTYWAQLYGYQVSFVTLDYHDSKLALENGEIDVIASGTYDKNNTDEFYTSIPYLELKGVLFQNKTYKSPQHADKKLRIASHSPMAPKSPLEATENFIDGENIETMHYLYMESILGQLYDFDLIYSFMPHQDEDMLVRDLETYIHNSNVTIPLMIRAITKRQNRQLMLDINEGIRTINRISAEATLDVSTLEDKGGFKILLGNYLTHLSTEQQIFILENPVITYGISEGYPPYYFSQFGQLYGLNADLFLELRDRIGITFKAINYNSYERALHALKRNTISLLPLVYETPLRQDNFLFTDAIDKYSAAIISRNNSKRIKLEDLKEAKIAVVRGNQVTNIIKNKLPNARLLFMNKESEALNAVNKGKVDAYVGNIPNSVYLINKLQLENLYLHNSNDFDSDMHYSMAVSKAQPVLQTLLNLGLRSIDQDTLAKYRSKWMKTILIQGNDERYEELYFVLIILAICSIVIFIGYFSFNQYQKKNYLKAQNKIQHALLEAQKSRLDAEQSALAKTEFLARMSHEIRTPMNGVLGMAEAISFTELNAEQKDLLNTLHHSALNLMGLLNDVLDFSKMDAGKMILDSRVFSLKSMLNHVIDNFRYQASSKGIVISTNIDTELQSYYIGDDMRLTQVFNNLLSNALKFTPKGSITVHINKAKQSTAAEKNESSTDFQEIIVEIQDTGIGITADKIDTLFTPFVQAENHTTRRFGGSGLGLSICKEIITAMEGDIKVTSMPKLGSIFTFSFLLKVCDQIKSQEEDFLQGKQRQAADMNTIASFKVLLAEDNAVNRKVLCGQLTRLGLNVDTAENGLIAYQMYKENDYDIILSDCHMPEMDGFTLASNISQERTHKTPILIAITADALSEATQRCLDAGFDHYLSKPCPIDILRNKLLEIQELVTPILAKKLTSKEVSNEQQSEIDIKTRHLKKEYTLMMSGDDSELVDEMMVVFLETIPEDMKNIQIASEQLVYTQAKALAHKIKGAIQYFGAEELASIAKDLERYAKKKDKTNMQQQTKLFVTGLEELQKEIQDWKQQI